MKWTKENGKFSSRVTLQGHASNKLKIKSFEDEDVGVYSCTLEDTANRLINKLSIVVKSIQIDLFTVSILDSLITPKLQIKNVKSIYDLNRTKKLDIECITNGNYLTLPESIQLY